VDKVEELNEVLVNNFKRPINLCLLSLGYKFLEDTLKIRFRDADIVGMGLRKYIYVRIGSMQCMFEDFLIVPELHDEAGVMVSMRQNEEAPLQLLVKVMDVLCIKKTDIKWLSEYLSPPSWQVTGIDGGKDNFSLNFHIKQDADRFAKERSAEGAINLLVRKLGN